MVTITPSTEADIPLIQAIAHQTWPMTFGNILSTEQIAYMLDMMYCESALQGQLREKGHVFLLATNTETKQPLGFISYELDYQHKPVTKIHKIYLLPESQGKGVGRALIDAVAGAAQAQKNNRLSLNVNRYNKAIRFYERMGFSTVGTEDITIGNGFLMEDFIMEKPLIA